MRKTNEAAILVKYNFGIKPTISNYLCGDKNLAPQRTQRAQSYPNI
jgi:hypothetical protein